MPEATARYQMIRALEDENGVVKSFGWKFYLDEEKFKTVIEDLRSSYPIRLKPYLYPPKEETEARAWNYDAKSDLAEAQGNGAESCRYFEKMDATLGQAIALKQQLEERGVKVD